MKTLNFKNQQKGVILIVTTIILGILLLLGTYFLTFSVAESKISKSQIIASQTYYLAEAGINEAIWKLTNDPAWKEDFETEPGCYGWSANFSSENILFPNSSYQVQIQNSDSDCARGEITAFSTLAFAGKTAQRIVKTGVFKAIGNPIEGIAVFSGGGGKHDELKIHGSAINIDNGNLFSNDEIKIEKGSQVAVTDNSGTEELEGQILAVKEFKLKDSIAVYTEIHAENPEYSPPPAFIPMPALDFDSYKNQAQVAEDAGECSVIGVDSGGEIVATRAQCVFSSSEFEDLLWDVGEQGTLTLNNYITYVRGSAKIRGGKILIVNGVLAADKNIEIGKKYSWKRKKEDETQEGNNQLIINNTEGKASGLLSKKKIEFGKYTSDVDISGLLYANKEMKLKKMSNTFTMEGGIIAKKIKFEDMEDIDISLNDTIVGYTLGDSVFSPIINIEHWEEAY